MSQVPQSVIQVVDKYREVKNFNAAQTLPVMNAVIAFPRGAIIFDGSNVEIHNSKIPAGGTPEVKNFLQWLGSQQYTKHMEGSGTYYNEADHELVKQIAELEFINAGLVREKDGLVREKDGFHATLKQEQNETLTLKSMLNTRDQLSCQLETENKSMDSVISHLEQEKRMMCIANEGLLAENANLKHAVTKHEESLDQKTEETVALKAAVEEEKSKNEALALQIDQLKNENARLKAKSSQVIPRQEMSPPSMLASVLAVMDTIATASAEVIMETSLFNGKRKADDAGPGSKKRAREGRD